MKSFLQTPEWLAFQKSLGRQVWHFDDGKIMTNIIRHDLPFRKGYLYLPAGPTLRLDQMQSGLKNETSHFVNYLKNLAKETKSFFIKMEPLEDVVPEILYTSVKLKRSKKNIQPHRTILVDLNLSEEDLFAKMHHKTRYNIKVAEKHGITIKPSLDIDLFWKLLQKTAKRDKFSSHKKEYYKSLLNFFAQQNGPIKTDLVLAYKEDKPVAGAIVLTRGDAGYYLHGASDYEYRSLMAPHLLHWDIIKYLKKNNFKHYDLWGIDSSKWPGVTRFKLGFGGKVIEYPGSFDLPVSRLWYLIYNIARKIF